MTIIDVQPSPPAPASPQPPSSGAAPAHWTGARADSRWLAAARSAVSALAADAARHDRDGTFVTAGITRLRELRCTSMLVPLDLGGGGATLAETCAVLAELARGCPSTALTLSMHSHLVAAQVWRHERGMPAPVLPKVAASELLLVSTGASDWMESNGSATRVDGGYRVTARKSPASGAPAGDVVVTSVRWEGGADGPQVIHCSVPFAADGVSIDATWDAMGMRGTGSHTIVFDDVFVPDAAVSLVRPAGAWHPVWSVVLGVALPLIMSTYVGVAEAAAELAIEIAKGARDTDAAVRTVGRMLTSLQAARDGAGAMVAASEGFGFDNTAEHAATMLARKATVVDAVLDTTRLAMEVGGRAFGVDVGIERLHRDAHGALYHPLSAEAQARFTGRVALGLTPI